MVGGIFFDRDGVINKLVYHKGNGEWGPPRTAGEIQLVPGISTLIHTLSKKYKVFVVSNQPDAAKDYTDYNDLMSVLSWFENVYREDITEFYWCLHHPSRCKCLCRKPGTWSVERALMKYDLNPSESWFIGDRDTDIQCGVAAGLHTIKIVDYNLNEVYERLL